MFNAIQTFEMPHLRVGSRQSLTAAIVLGAFLMLLLPAPAFAQTANFDNSAMAQGLAQLVNIFNGRVARALGVLAVIGMGVAALTGKVEWSRAVIVVLGVGLVFSASALINLLFPANQFNTVMGPLMVPMLG